MSEAAYWGWIRSSLRKMSQRWKPIYGVLNDVKRPVEPSDKLKWGNLIKFVYQCCQCKAWFPKKHVEVDHIHPCGSLKSEADIGPFVTRLLCERDGLRVVCIDCHLEITNAEREAKAQAMA